MQMIDSFIRNVFRLKFPFIMTIIYIMVIITSLPTPNWTLLQKILILQITAFSWLEISMFLLLIGREVCPYQIVIFTQN